MVFLFISVSFWILDNYSISLGDDFGYMFADSSNHAGDGPRVTKFLQCLKTQFNHYFSTNGRFLVHVTNMTMLNLVPKWFYHIFNALAFGSFCFLSFILGFRRHRNLCTSIILLCMIWWLIPDFGVITLSLLSYSINYLWPGVFVLALLWLLGKENKFSSMEFVCVCIFSFFCATLQESYSIPLSGAFIVLFFLNRKSLSKRQIIIRCLFIFGTLILVLAPGNISHFISGGGFEEGSLQHKFSSMLLCLLRSPIILIFILTGIWVMISPKECKEFIKDNSLFLLAIIIAVIFASFTFTAPRQFFAPSIFSIIILCRAIDLIRTWSYKFNLILSCILGFIWVLMFAGVFILRRNVYENFNNTLNTFQINKSSIIEGNVYETAYHKYPCLWLILGNYAPDPWERGHFSLPFDYYSKNGISRLNFGDNNLSSVGTVLPLSIEKLITIAPIQHINSDNKYKVTDIDSRYGLVVTDAPKPAEIKGIKKIESAMVGKDTLIVVVPSGHPYLEFVYK